MRPNVAQDAPPTSIEVGGFSYNIVDTDFRCWIDVLRLLKQVSINSNDTEDLKRFIDKISEIEQLVFGGVLVDENPLEVLAAIAEFVKGYPSAPTNNGSSNGSNERTFSFDYDLNEIVIAIWNQHHVNLMWNGEKCHWWLFLLYFHTLCGEHLITNIMQTRGYKGKDKEMLRHKHAVELPPEYSEAEKKAMDDFNSLFDTEEE